MVTDAQRERFHDLFWFLLPLIPFILLTVPNTAPGLADTNVYLMQAKSILEGKRIYGDFFYSNTPLSAYVQAGYLFLVGGNATWFYRTVIVEIAATAFVLFLTLRALKTPLAVSVAGTALYLFSLSTLIATKSQNGIALGVLFALLGYSLYIHRRFQLSGAILALMVLTKAYLMPVALGLFIHALLLQRKAHAKRYQCIGSMLVSFAGTGIALFALMAHHSIPAFLNGVLGFSVQRPVALEKSRVFGFFLSNDWLPASLSALAVWLHRRVEPEHCILAGYVLFLLLFGDLYYIYFAPLLPFLVLAARHLPHAIPQKYREFGTVTLVAVLGAGLLLNVVGYLNRYAALNRVDDVAVLVEKIRREQPDAIYGVYDITPLLSYLSGVPLLGGIIDTNMALFTTGHYDKQEMTKQLISGRNLLIGYGLRVPEGKVSHLQTALYDVDTVRRECTLIFEHPINFEHTPNLLEVYRCW